MENFHKARFSKEKEAQVTAGSSAPTNANSPSRALSVDLLNAQIPSLPSAMLQSLVKKSEELLNRPGAITSAPGNSNALMVESQTSTRPHFVEIKKKWKSCLTIVPHIPLLNFVPMQWQHPKKQASWKNTSSRLPKMAQHQLI